MLNQIISNYKIVGRIAEGGMGTVYEAYHMRLDRRVAIKQLHAGLTANERFRERFINEARILAQLNHQNIVSIYDLTEESGQYYIIMEFVEGETIDIILDRESGYIHQSRVLNIFKQILSAFEYAHNKGIIHRDIKPSNIILRSDDTPKILDFGIAKIIESNLSLTKTGTRMGSVYYMSPEQVLGYNVDKRSDIYSLGVLLYEMLSKKLPYDIPTDSEYEIMNAVVKQNVFDVRNIRRDIDNNISYVIMKACAKDVNERFQSCSDFLSALGNYNYVYNRPYVTQSSAQSTVSSYEQRATQIIGDGAYTVPTALHKEPVKPRRYISMIMVRVAVVFVIFILLVILIRQINKESDSETTSYKEKTTEKKSSYSDEKKTEPLVKKNTEVPGEYPEASTRYLTASELRSMSKYELRIMRNEIFARHGYIFKTAEMRSYFNSQSWYTPLYDDVSSKLSHIEKENINLIKSFER